MGILAWIVVGLNCGLACGHGDEGRRLRRLDFRRAGNLAWRWNDWIDYCCFRRCSDTRVDYPLAQESLMGTPGPIVRAVWASGSSPINASLPSSAHPALNHGESKLLP